MKKLAFTMAEVLITLGVIGIVAAMTLPALIGNYKKKVTVTRLQRTYTVLAQAFERSRADNGDPSEWGLGAYSNTEATVENLKEIEDIKEDLRRAIQSAAEKRKDLEGLTLLGGEPFDQAQEAAQLAKEAKKHGLSVLTFTGYRLEELRKKGPAERKLLKRTDLLIDGPFEEEKKSFDRPLVGSSNQRFHFLTDRYKKEDIMSWKNSFEIRIDQDGRIWINGMGDLAGLRDYEKRRHSSNEISWD